MAETGRGEALADVEVNVDPETVTRVLSDIKKFQPALSTGIRRQIRNAGKIVLSDVQDEIREYRSSGGGKMREQLAKSVAVRMYTSTGAKKQGVQIVSTGRLLPPQKRALVKAMNLASFRHAVWGNYSTGEALSKSLRARKADKAKSGGHHYVEQAGMRYFRAQVVRRHETTVDELISAAVNEALEALQ